MALQIVLINMLLMLSLGLCADAKQAKISPALRHLNGLPSVHGG